MLWASRTILLLPVLLGIQLWAQATNTAVTTQGGSFDQIHQALSSAADNLLAATAQYQPSPSEMGAVSAQNSEAADANILNSASSPERAWQRVEQLRPIIEPILREEGVPTELVAVVLIESGGQPMALSPKGARGIWQFMPDTARRYGLVVSAGADERLDVQKSTRAAARYLRDLYQRFGSWPLALAAYNAGEDAVDAASGKARSAEFVRISSWLPLETRTYVPAVLSAMGRVPTPRQAPLLAGGKRNVLYPATSLD